MVDGESAATQESMRRATAGVGAGRSGCSNACQQGGGILV
jgi:hypothetical protein